MLGSYFDESSVDGSGPVSVVGGLLIDHANYSWLDIDWSKAVYRSNIGKDYIHMLDFGAHGDLASFPLDQKRALLTDLAAIINK